MDSDVVKISEANQAYEILGDKAYFKLNGDDPDLFPSIPTIEPSGGVDVSLREFVELCNRTTFAAAKEMGRYAFNGVLLEIDPEGITLVATDGRRLSLAKLPYATGVTERCSAVVPIKGLIQLQRLMTEDEQTLRIELRESMVALLLPHAEVQAQLVQGDFPDFRAVVPGEQDVPGVATIGKEDLATAIQRALVTAGDDGPKVELSFSGGNLTVASSTEGLGELRSDMAIDYSGDEVIIRFNPNFIGEYLKTMPEEQLTFRFKDRASAGLFKVSDESVYVLMPITS
jgi:DNA polymerase-3 subunit beta